MPDQDKKEEKNLNYVQGYVSEGGYTIDATNIRKRLAKEAYERYTEQEETDLQQYTEEQYISAIYPNETEEYLVEGAVLGCTMTTLDKKIYRDKKYSAVFPSERTVLKVTKNKEFTCCDLPHATVKDAEKDSNIPPFRCNCMLAPYTAEEWGALEADETCLKEGTCKALMNLNQEWDNLPRVDGDECQKINGVPSINMGSILFCRHGGIISVITSGQEELFALACTSGGDHAGGLLEEQQKANAEYIFNFLKKQGWTTEAICGVLGNMQKESSMNPGAWQSWESPVLGFGLVQWSQSKEFLDFAHLKAIEASELAESDPHKMMDIQLDYFMKSFYGATAKEEENEIHIEKRWLPGMAQPYYNIMPLSEGVPKEMTVKEFSKAEYGCGDLALVFHATYERSGDDKAGLQKRVDYAGIWYRYFTEGVWEGL